MKTADFDFPLPENLIAKIPVPERGGSRLMVLGAANAVEHRGYGVEHRGFADLHEYLNAGDMIVLNNTRVLPCRLRGVRRGGRELEVLLVRPIEGRRWEVLSAGGYSGPLEIAPGVHAEMHKGLEADLYYEGDLEDMLERIGEMPLPPYLKRRATGDDRQWYQTEYAEVPGSIAAPTAGLHFTGDLLNRLSDKGVLVRYLTLHVGKGTFMPVRVQDVAEHSMQREYFEVHRSLMDEIGSLKGRLFAVGTTTTRTLEAVAGGNYEPVGAVGGEIISGTTDIFITPGYRFRAVQGLLTNFHLPKSTPLMLASAFAGRDRLLRAYTEAVGEAYRFFSYGDAMLIFNGYFQDD